MYRIKNKINFKNQAKIADKIGISKFTLNRILNGKQATQKTTAYCIVKCYDENAELNDYFSIEK